MEFTYSFCGITFNRKDNVNSDMKEHEENVPPVTDINRNRDWWQSSQRSKCAGVQNRTFYSRERYVVHHTENKEENAVGAIGHSLNHSMETERTFVKNV